MEKYIWSDRYGTNPGKGINLFLQSYLPGYKHSMLEKVINPFVKELKASGKGVWKKKYGRINLNPVWTVSYNWELFLEYIKQYKEEDRIKELIN